MRLSFQRRSVLRSNWQSHRVSCQLAAASHNTSTQDFSGASAAACCVCPLASAPHVLSCQYACARQFAGAHILYRHWQTELVLLSAADAGDIGVWKEVRPPRSSVARVAERVMLGLLQEQRARSRRLLEAASKTWGNCVLAACEARVCAVGV